MVDFVDKYLKDTVGELNRVELDHVNAREGDFDIVDKNMETIFRYMDYHLGVEEHLFRQITDLNNVKKTQEPSYHELQIWCADMWAVLWGGWRRGAKTNCHPNFEFSWGTSTKDDYHRLNIMHNAGVTSPNEGLFFKAQYMNELPYNKDLQIRPESASSMYWEWINLTASKSVIK